MPLRGRLSYANVTATLALFVALGGSTYAATKVRGKDIAPRTITAKNVKRGTLTGNELARGAITAAKLSAGVRALLPAQDDFGGPGGDALPGLDGLPGLPGEDGLPGEPGPPGSACPAEQGLLCGTSDLPAGQIAALRINGAAPVVLRAAAYRISCTKPATCLVLLKGEAPGTEAAARYAAPETDYRLTVEPSAGGTAARSFTIVDAVPTALVSQGDDWQLTLTADAAGES